MQKAISIIIIMSFILKSLAFSYSKRIPSSSFLKKNVLQSSSSSSYRKFSSNSRFSSSLLYSQPPIEPSSFGKEFEIKRDPIRKLELELINEHPIDYRITFDEKSHVYSFDGIQLKYSVTEFISQYFDKFDPDIAIDKMKKSSRWPRPEYSIKDKNGQEVALSDKAIKEKWNQTGEYARNRGSWMHYNIERFLNNLEPSKTLKELQQFENFYNEVVVKRGIEPWRTEWRIAAPDLSLGGSVDFVGKCLDGTYAIIDWKRSKNLESSIGNGYGRKAKTPLEHIDDCEGSKYFLQLNLYRYILQKYYNLNISTMILTSFHPNQTEYFHIDVPVWENEIESIMSSNDKNFDATISAPNFLPPQISSMKSPFKTK